MNILLRVLGTFSVAFACYEGFYFATQLMNYPDDFAFFGGLILMVVTVYVAFYGTKLLWWGMLSQKLDNLKEKIK